MKVKNGPDYDSNLENFTQQHLRSLGYEITCRDKSLPGTPDIVLRTERVAVLVHGCFYHAHGAGCSDSHVPVTRREFWQQKFARTKDRDRRNLEQLIAMGYRVIVLWGCALRCNPPDRLIWALKTFIEGELPHQEMGNLELSWFYSAAQRSGSVSK